MPIAKKKDPLEKLYKELENAHANLADHRETHRKVFAQEAALREEVEILEAKIKAAVRPLYTGKPSGDYTAYKGNFMQLIVTSKYQREVDIPGLRRIAGDHSGELIKESVDLKRLDALVESGDLNREDVDKVVKKIPTTPAVSVRSVKENG